MGTQTERMDFRLLAPDAHEVSLAGTFNDWTPRPMEAGADGIWTREEELEEGLHEYRFIVDGVWQADPACARSAPNDDGSSNSVVEIPTGERS